MVDGNEEFDVFLLVTLLGFVVAGVEELDVSQALLLEDGLTGVKELDRLVYLLELGTGIEELTLELGFAGLLTLELGFAVLLTLELGFAGTDEHGGLQEMLTLGAGFAETDELCELELLTFGNGFLGVVKADVGELLILGVGLGGMKEPGALQLLTFGASFAGVEKVDEVLIFRIGLEGMEEPAELELQLLTLGAGCA